MTDMQGITPVDGGNAGLSRTATPAARWAQALYTPPYMIALIAGYAVVGLMGVLVVFAQVHTQVGVMAALTVFGMLGLVLLGFATFARMLMAGVVTLMIMALIGGVGSMFYGSLG